MILVPVRRSRRAIAGIALAIGISALLCNGANATQSIPLKVGTVTRHPERFVGQHVLLSGYLLAREAGYILFSDEPRGRISRFDLPVIGARIEQMVPGKKYLIEGEFLEEGVAASNGNRYRLVLGASPHLAEH